MRVDGTPHGVDTSVSYHAGALVLEQCFDAFSALTISNPSTGGTWVGTVQGKLGEDSPYGPLRCFSNCEGSMSTAGTVVVGNTAMTARERGDYATAWSATLCLDGRRCAMELG